MSTALALPANGDASTWTAQEAAIAEAAGLIQRGRIVPRPIAEAFLHHCSRTGLDPVARQIYLIERGGKHNIQVSIDGALLVAQRSGKYAGHTPYQWTDGTRQQVPMKDGGQIVRNGDGSIVFTEEYVWLDMWPADKGAPVAARVGVHHADFLEPVWAVANFDAYNAGGPMWKKMAARMLGKCAMMLALREAFPQDLSGLYSTEEMDQAGKGSVAPQTAPSLDQMETPKAEAAPASAPQLDHSSPEIAKEWIEAIDAAPDKASLKTLYGNAKGNNALRLAVQHGDKEENFISLHAYFGVIGNLLPDSVDKKTGEVDDNAPMAMQEETVSDDLLAQAQAGIHVNKES
ncbi:MAG: recombinase RecT [Brevibacterium aurantiacum]